MKSIKVLQVLDKINYNSGVSAVVTNYYFYISHTKVQFDFLLFEDAEEELRKNLTVQGAGIFVTGQPSGKNIRVYQNNVDEFFKQHGAEYQVVHVHVPNAAFVVLKSAKKYGIPVRILHSHNARGADGTVKKIRNFVLNKWGICYANRYMACSVAAGEYLFGRKRCAQGQVEILNNAISLDKYRYNKEKRREIRDALGVGEETLIGHVGRFAEQKNHMGLLDIFLKLCEQGWNGKLVLLGTGELRTAVEKKAEEMNIRSRIIFAGVVSNVNEYMSAMDIFLLPSLYEGLPVVCVEAQAAGLPCVISDRISRETKVSDRVQFLNINEIEAWCDCIRKIEINENERSYIGQSELDGFDITKQARRLEALYHLYYKEIVQGTVKER